MKAVANILIAVAMIAFMTAIVSKLSGGGLYNIDVKPLAGLAFGNTCLLLALVINTFKK